MAKAQLFKAEPDRIKFESEEAARDIEGLISFFRNLQIKFQNVKWYSLNRERQGGHYISPEYGVSKEEDSQTIFFYCPVINGQKLVYHQLFLKGDVLYSRPFLPDFINRQINNTTIHESKILDASYILNDEYRKMISRYIQNLKNFAAYVNIPQPDCFHDIRPEVSSNPVMEWGHPLAESESSWPNKAASEFLQLLSNYMVDDTVRGNADLSLAIKENLEKILQKNFGVNGVLDDQGTTLMELRSTSNIVFQEQLLKKGAFISGTKLGRNFNHITNAFFSENFELANYLVDVSIARREIKKDAFPFVLALVAATENCLFKDQKQKIFSLENAFSPSLRHHNDWKMTEETKILIKIIEADLEILNCRYEKFHDTSILGLLLQNGHEDSCNSSFFLKAIGSILSNPEITAKYPNFKLTGVDELGNSDYFYLIASGLDADSLEPFKQFTADEHKRRENILGKDGKNPLYYLFSTRCSGFGVGGDNSYNAVDNIISNCCESPDAEEYKKNLEEFIISGKVNLIEYAISQDILAFAEHLIDICEEKGVAINFTNRFLGEKDGVGNTPLHKLAGVEEYKEEASSIISHMLKNYNQPRRPEKSRKVDAHDAQPATEIQTARGTKRPPSPLAGVGSDHENEL